MVISNEEPDPEAFYLGISSGIDNYTGLLGLGAQVPIIDKFALRGGAGLGAWGGKLSAGVKYESLVKKGLGVGLSYSHCTGANDLVLTLDDGTGDPRDIDMDLLPVGSVNLTANYNWVFKKGDKLFYLEYGYAFGTGGSKYYKINDGSVLTSGEELILRIMRPGGIILAMGLLIGF
ncbi:hypothetical protein [Marinoscillum sp. MHG1-6]|uniref:hypothetical protein n=1 Tax=Marinoscillum sp. MHG1-6 TaxID=2959627 RepID=UPI0021572588|nr:hypothetical protein [Marinoscillum sp. MHG1-6]